MLFMCRPVLLSTSPVYLPTMYMLKSVFMKRSICRHVYLSTCLPADHVHGEIYIYNMFNVPTCLPVYLYIMHM